MSKAEYEPLDYVKYSQEQSETRSEEFYLSLRRRRSVREFSDRAVSRSAIENCLKTAGSAPSGANKQPWFFCVVSDDSIKKQIRIEAEKVEQEFYAKKANEKWVDDLKFLGTNTNKNFLEQAPYLIVVFSRLFDITPGGGKIKNYYVSHSVGIAVGFLIAAIHNNGLVTVPYTPAPMDFLNRILKRGRNERPFCILPVGYPAENIKVPKIKRKKLKEFSLFI